MLRELGPGYLDLSHRGGQTAGARIAIAGDKLLDAPATQVPACSGTETSGQLRGRTLKGPLRGNATVQCRRQLKLEHFKFTSRST